MTPYAHPFSLLAFSCNPTLSSHWRSSAWTFPFSWNVICYRPSLISFFIPKIIFLIKATLTTPNTCPTQMISFILPLFLFFCFLGPHSQHLEVPRLGSELDLQLPAYNTATATATPDPSPVCDLHHSSQQCRILNPLELGEARD